MRIMAFDAGTKRVGVSVGDDTLSVASPLGMIENNPTLVSELQKLFDEYGPQRVVVGNPLNMDGTKNSKTKFADDLAEIVKAIAPEKEIVMWDERLTSFEAGEMLAKNKIKKEKRKGIVDKVAATIILQSYLDHLKGQKKND